MIKAIKNMGAFSVGMLVGVCYGAIIATITSYIALGAL
tara:strand:- start:1144 stop:1257 length:114 start_codon:yes stop_codon:yes gene_type:complete